MTDGGTFVPRRTKGKAATLERDLDAKFRANPHLVIKRIPAEGDLAGPRIEKCIDLIAEVEIIRSKG